MSIIKYFKSSLPTPSHIGDSLTAAANKELKWSKSQALTTLSERGNNIQTTVMKNAPKLEDTLRRMVMQLLLVQQYLRALRAAGTPVNTAIVVASTRGIVMTKDQSLLTEYGKHICLTPSWAKSLLIRMGMVYRKASTSQSKLAIDELSLAKFIFYSRCLEW